MRIEIPGQVEWILNQLRDAGYEAFAVGGCVRDALLGRIPGDWDITTSARPDEVKRVFKRTVDTGIRHGTVTVMRDRAGYEITTYRIDGEYEDGRHPREVSFTSQLREDLRRRDFTINAMAYSHETGIVDLFGGMEDLENRVIRCVGDPMERFTEDALRILRAIRFSAQLNFSIEEKTCRALSCIAPNLANVSKERIQAELTKTLLSAHPERITLVEASGMSRYVSEAFGQVFPEGMDLEKLEARWARAAALREDRSLRWAAFLADCGEETAGRILRELKMDNATIGSVRTYVKWLPQPFCGDRYFLRRVMSRMSDGSFDGLLELKAVFGPEAEAGELRPEAERREQVEPCPEPERREQVELRPEPVHREQMELRPEAGRRERIEPCLETSTASLEQIRAASGSIRRAGDCIRLKDMAVTGADLIAAGMRPGPALGRALEELFAQVLKDPGKNEKAALLEAAKRYLTDEKESAQRRGGEDIAGKQSGR